MKITIYNFKGGVGKTSLSLNIAISLNLPIVTNDKYSCLERLLDKKNFIKLEKNQTIPSFKKEHGLLFDFGGYADERVSKVISISNYIIIPVINEYSIIQSTINTIKEVENINKNIIIIVNRTKKEDFNYITQAFKQLNFNYPIFEIKESKSMQNMLTEKKTITKMISEGGLKAYNYKKINKQFNNIINFLKKHNDR